MSSDSSQRIGRCGVVALPKWRAGSWGCGLFGMLALLLASGCGDDGTSSSADAGIDCGDHGTVSDGVCRCDTGYSGDTCTVADDPSTTTADASPMVPEAGASTCDGASCGAHGRCDSQAGGCLCSEGYTGATCAGCADGYHATNGECEADETCAAASCAGHASCDDASGSIVCECAPGYASGGCEDCAAGYHAEGDSCVADTACLETTCGDAGTCTASAGALVCECADGYAGDRCQDCATGYHADEELCVGDESCNAASCSANGSCNDAEGVVRCDCALGSGGDDCSECDPGLALNAQGQCVPACDAGVPTQLEDGGFACLTGCDPGYVGPDCSACADGYRAVGSTCLPNAECDSQSCSGRGDCDDSSGELVCVCNPGFLGDDCAVCDAGLHPDSDGCASAVTCNAESCSAHGSCDDSTGVIVCSCDQGYTGTECAACATDFALDDDVCVPLELGDTCTITTCSGRGSCDDSTGTAVCTCDETYGGLACQACATGFVANQAGACVPSVCGDGIIDPNLGEDCDDGNAISELCTYQAHRVGCTICDSACKEVPGVPRYCGDGQLQANKGETCDDGEDNGEYAANLQSANCDANCGGIGPYCGDGDVDGLFGETCDDGTDPDIGNSNGRVDACRTTCHVASCGDGVVDSNEDCDDADSDGNCPQSCIEEAGAPDAGVSCEQTLTHSVDTATISMLNSVSCFGDDGHSDNSYARIFSLAALDVDSYTVTQVRVGIEEATSDNQTQPVSVRIYQGTGDPPTPENVTLLATENTVVAAMTNQFITVPISATVSGGPDSYLVAEFFTPDGQSSNTFLFIGSNANGQTDEGYMLASACGLPSWSPTGNIGFGEMHMLIHVDGFASGPICAEAPAPADAGPI